MEYGILDVLAVLVCFASIMHFVAQVFSADVDKAKWLHWAIGAGVAVLVMFLCYNLVEHAVREKIADDLERFSSIENLEVAKAVGYKIRSSL